MTKDELTIGNVQRKVEPAANERHRFDNGQKSKQKFLGVEVARKEL